MSINYTLWPNPEGPLGKNKVTIPDGINVTWPEGDALVGNFVYNEGKLVGFVDTMALVANESNSTTIPYDFVDITVDKSLESSMTFIPGERCKDLNISYAENGNTIVLDAKYLGCKTVDDIKAVDPDYLTNDIIDGVWSERLDDLEQGEYMFIRCSNLTSFTSDLSSLKNGYNMFANCSQLESFSSNLPSLTNGEGMFYNTKIKSFSSDLSSLTEGTVMFANCTNLRVFSSDLSSLKNGSNMFNYCSNLTTFYSDLSSLTNGYMMFNGCSNLHQIFSDSTNFLPVNLSSLTNGYMMFSGCKLDGGCVQGIADTINTVSNNNTLDIGIGKYEPDEGEVAAFNKMVSKGWIVYVNSSYWWGGDSGGYYGYAASASLAASVMSPDEIGETEMFAPKPYWAKPVQTDEEYAKYVDSEGNFYNILGAQFIYGDDLSTYGMFTCEEDAAANMRLTKIEK